jgi:DNA polymerase I
VSGSQLIQTSEAFQRFLGSVREAPFLALDTETSGLDPNQDRVLLLQFGTADKQALVDAQRMRVSDLQSLFRCGQPVVMHNASFDLKMLRATYGPDLGLDSAEILDTMLIELLLRNGRSSDVAVGGAALRTLAQRYAGMDLDKSIRQGFQGAEAVEDLSDAELRYAVRDVEATWKVLAAQLPLVEREGLFRASSVECAAASAFSEMELMGTPIDVNQWREVLKRSEQQRVEARMALDRELSSVVDRDLFGQTNLQYEDDAAVLAAFGRLGLEVSSASKDALRRANHPAAAALLAYREQTKLVSTYGESFLAHVHPKTGRLHPQFKSLGAVTGRASCKEPNLQNIPSDSAFRRCFRAPDGRQLVTADYATVELRIIAELSEDPVFLEAFEKGEDLHSRVASRIFQKSVSRTENPDLRARAKLINFGLVYGMGGEALAHELGLDRAAGDALLETYFRSFPRIRRYLEGASKEAVERGYATTLSGRKLWFVDARRSGKDNAALLRLARNMPVQGSSADMTKLAMARLVRSFRAEQRDAFLVNMVHDELVVECRADQAESVRKQMVDAMVSAGQAFLKKVPIEVETSIADSWAKSA